MGIIEAVVKAIIIFISNYIAFYFREILTKEKQEQENKRKSIFKIIIISLIAGILIYGIEKSVDSIKSVFNKNKILIAHNKARTQAILTFNTPMTEMVDFPDNAKRIIIQKDLKSRLINYFIIMEDNPVKRDCYIEFINGEIK